MNHYILLISLWSTELLAQVQTSVPALLVEASKEKYVSYADVNELKIYILAGIGTMLGFVAKEIIKWWNKRNDTSELDEKEFKKDVLRKLAELKNIAMVHRSQLEHLSDTKVSTGEVHDIITERISWSERK